MKKNYIFILVSLLFAGVAFAQKPVKVTGFVQDSQSRSGVSNITIRSTKLDRGLGSTNRRGYFEVNTTDDDVLEFTSTDYETHREVLKGKNIYTFTVYLSKRENAIEEVVVQGYQQRRRETLTGSSVRIDGSSLQDIPTSNVMELLQGKVAGMNVQINSGQPGARTQINIRGVNNVGMTGAGQDAFMTPTSPLFVIDGVQVDDNTDYQYGFEAAGAGISPIALIPPEDIESMDVLKDAAATALYGSRGAYGVIIITTKRGQSKVPIIQYSTNQFLNVPPRLRSTMGGADERRSRINQVMTYAGDQWSARDQLYDTQILSDSLNMYFNNSTDWQGVFYNSRYSQSHNVNASGGDITFNYKINGQYFNERGIIENTGFNRYTLNMNTQYMPSTKFRLFTSMSGNIGEQQAGSGTSVRQGGVASSASATSLLPPPSAGFVREDILSGIAGRNDNRTTDLRTAIDLDYEFVEGLRFRNNFSYTYINDRTNNFMPAIANNNLARSYNYDAQRNRLYNMTQLNYVKEVGDHMVNAFVFTELTAEDFQAKAQRKTGLPNDQYEGPFAAGGSNAFGGVLNNAMNFRSAGFAGALSYNFATKYILDFNFRLDKQSNNGPEAPWSRNPAFSARWNVEREAFMEDWTGEWLDFLSIRASWGRNIVPTGNIFDANGRYVYTGFFNNSPTIGFNWNHVPNRDLVPSTTTQSGIALEAGFFENKITTTQEFFWKRVDSQLWEKSLADHNGFVNIKTNEVSNVNMGYEFMVNYRPISQRNGWEWNIGLNGSIIKDVLTSLPDQAREFTVYDDNLHFHTLYRLGRNTMSLVLFDYKGVYSTDADVPVNPATGEPLKIVSGTSTHYFQAGDPIWTDLNGDYIIDDNDLVVMGNAQPLVVGGLSSFARYKAWSLNTQISYTLIRDIVNAALANQIASYANPLMTGDNARGGTRNSARLPFNEFNFWTQPGDNADFPNPYDYERSSLIRPYRSNQTLFVEDGSYFKINYITLGYNVPREKTERYSITSLRLFFTANNVATFSSYSGPNPELVTAAGYDRTDGYPVARSYTVGLNIQF